MKDKATLTLMELLIMVLVFSLAAALCLKAFVWSTQKAQENKVVAEAAILAQNEAERLKSSRTAAEETQYFDENWQPAAEGCYKMSTLPYSGALLGGAELVVADDRGHELFRLTVRWQEDAA